MTGSLNYGGLEASIFNIYKKINKKFFQFDFITCSQSAQRLDDEIIGMGGDIYRLSSRSRQPHLYVIELIKLLKKNNYKIFHVHTNSAGAFLDVLAAKIAGTPHIIVHSHNTSCIRKTQHYIFKPLLNLIPKYQMACSKEAGEWLFNKKNTIIIENGIDIEKYTYKKEIRDKIRSELKIKDEIVLGNIGSFQGVKNQEMLLDIMDNLKEKNLKYKLLLIGDGQLKKSLENRTATSKIKDDVIFLGNRDDAHEILNAMDFFLFPSHFEGLGIALIEAQISGLECIASTGVPALANISDRVKFLDLNDGIKPWVENITNKSNHTRLNYESNYIKSKWNSSNSAKKLSDFYCKILQQEK